MHKIFFFLAGIFFLTGIFYLFGDKLGIGRLPGDLSFKGENYQIHFPIMTCLIISAVMSLILWIIRR